MPAMTGGVRRLAHLDALRGLAALAVVLHHLLHSTVYNEALRDVLPRPVTWLQDVGDTGVEVFFVLSGFVILLSLHSTRMDGPGAGRFVLRRQARLDPPYWTVVLLALVVLVVEQGLGYATELHVDPATVLANLLYLQNVLQVDQVVDVAWTLCLEIQFYLVLVLVLLVCGRRDRARTSAGGEAWSLPAVLGVTGVASALGSWTFSAHVLTTWAIGTWHCFAVGALLCLCLRRPSRAARWSLGVLLLVEVVSLVLSPGLPERSETAAVLLAATFITAGERGFQPVLRLAKVRWIQYLGSRSYSLYLVHLTVLVLVMRVVFKVLGPGPLAAILALVLAAGACLAAGEVLHRAVERPAMRLSVAIRDDGPRGVYERVRARCRDGALRLRRAP
jgi:peptidoglycan/LPS O-acetylase OafA/YrhL